MVTLQPGTKVDRYGPPTGTYLSPEGVPYDARALPPGSKADGYSQFTVIKPFTVEKADVAPAFDKTGGGVQFRVITPSGTSLRVDVDYLVKNGYLVK
ncbi:TNT domain-containing protein [Leptothrix sp. BB-4]